jgi:hypothetical protein
MGNSFIIIMKKNLERDMMFYFGCAYHSWPSQTTARIVPSDASWWERAKNIDPYRIPMTKEQFFEDRPWLPKDDKLYEDYITEDMRMSNEIRKEKVKMWREHTVFELDDLFLLKKTS